MIDLLELVTTCLLDLLGFGFLKNKYELFIWFILLILHNLNNITKSAIIFNNNSHIFYTLSIAIH